MKTAEELLNEAIEKYNSQVNDISKFKLNAKELKMFTGVMEDYKKQFIGKLEFKEPPKAKCTRCDGIGVFGIFKLRCLECGGMGYVTKT